MIGWEFSTTTECLIQISITFEHPDQVDRVVVYLEQVEDPNV